MLVVLFRKGQKLLSLDFPFKKAYSSAMGFVERFERIAAAFGGEPFLRKPHDLKPLSQDEKDDMVDVYKRLHTRRGGRLGRIFTHLKK